MTQTIVTERLATVTALPPVDIEQLPRELRWREYHSEPAAVQPFARTEWRIEQQLDDTFEAGQSPFGVLRHFAPDVAAQARPLLEALFDAADAVHDHERGRGDGTPFAMLADEYADALRLLAKTLRGAV